MAGVVLLGIMILAVLLAPLYMSYSDMIHEDVFNKLRSPCAEHPVRTSSEGTCWHAYSTAGASRSSAA